MLNPSFEEYYSCPVTNDLNNGQLELAKGWWKPTWGTSDYFNQCNDGIVDVPNNFWGYQEAYHGDGYVGIVPAEWYSLTNEYFSFEYVQTKLEQTLKPCTRYHFEMKVSLANYSKYSFTKLGALFTKNILSINKVEAIVQKPQFINSSGILNDTLNWMTVGGDFTVNGGEKYLCIGFFFNSVINDTLFFQETTAFPDFGYGYYFIDSVSVVELDIIEGCDYAIPNIFTPNNDGSNDIWEFNSSTESHLEIFNRWGNSVYLGDGGAFVWDGSNCSDGVYFYNFFSEKYNKTGYIHLVR